jgi:hypothetical protein
MVRVQENYPVSYEKLATIYGNHQSGISLKADDFTKKCICFSKEELEDVFLCSSQTLEKSQQQYIDDLFFLFFHPNFLNDQIMNVRFLKSEKAKFFKYINLTDEKHMSFQHFTLVRFLEFFNMSLDQFYGLVGNLSTLLETYNEKLKSNSKKTLKKLESDSVPVSLLGEHAPGAIPVDISSNEFNNLFAVYETQDDLSETLENEKPPTSLKLPISSKLSNRPRPRRPSQPAAFMVNKMLQTNSEVENSMQNLDHEDDSAVFVEVLSENLNQNGGSKESLVTSKESLVTSKEPTLLTWNDISFFDKDKPHEFIDVEYSIIEKDEFIDVEYSIIEKDEDTQNDKIEDFANFSDDQLTEKIHELSQKGDPKILADFLQNIFNKKNNQLYNYKESMNKERSLQMNTKMLRERFALILEEINKVHGFKFAFYPEQQIAKNKHTLIFHSPCIYDTKEDNNFMVTLYLTKMGCNIHCYHQKCQELGKYKNIENSLRAKLIEINLKEQDSFMKSDGSTVAELISKLFRDSNF